MSSQWPVFRTARRDTWPVSNITLFSAAVLTWIMPVLLGGLVLGVAHSISGTFGLGLRVAYFAAHVAVFGGVISWVFLLAALPFAQFALRKGYAGWGVALICGGCLSCIGGMLIPVDGLFDRETTLAMCLSSGVAHGGIFWLMVRWLSADAIVKG